jgi:hypothetical protein
MTSQQAQETVKRYREVLAADDRRGSRRDPSLLPAPKAVVMTAVKLEIAQLYNIGSASEELVQPLIQSAMFLDSFTHESLDIGCFVQSMQRRRLELEEFHQQLLTIGRDGPFFWQKVYALVGVHVDTKHETLFNTVKRKLGFSPKQASTSNTTTARMTDGRFDLD